MPKPKLAHLPNEKAGEEAFHLGTEKQPVKDSKKMKVTLEYSEPTTIDHVYSVMAILMWLLTEIPGNGMLIGIIMFEKYGGDPLKRRICDRVVIHSFLTKLNTLAVNIAFNFGYLTKIAMFKKINMQIFSKLAVFACERTYR